jgi:glycosyltransferase 2 family protein
MTPFMKRLLYMFGGSIGLAGVIFVGLRLKAYSNEIDIFRFNVIVLFSLLVLVMIYGMANILLARAWWHLLIFFQVRPSCKWAVRVYGLSQLGKYVPGNIFHLAGRQSFGMAAGHHAMPLVKSTIWELGLLSFAGALFSFLLIPLLIPDFPAHLSWLLYLTAIFIAWILSSRLLSKQISSALLCQIIFLIISGSVFTGTLTVITGYPTISPIFVPLVCGAFIMSWLLGLLTPGAPAGLGVREMVLYFLLGGQIAQADLLLAIILSRAITVLGDLVFFWGVAFIGE